MLCQGQFSLLPSFPHKADSRSPFWAGAARSAESLLRGTGGASDWGSPSLAPLGPAGCSQGPELLWAGSRAITLITARPPRRWRVRPRRAENAPGPGRAWEPSCPPPRAAAAAGRWEPALEAVMVDKPAPPLAPLITGRRSALATPFIYLLQAPGVPELQIPHLVGAEQRQVRGPICQGKPSGQACGEVATRP